MSNLGKHIIANETSTFEVLSNLKGKHFDEFRSKNLDLVINKLQNSYTFDLMVVQATNIIEDIEKTANLFSKRLREWYGYYFPEVVRKYDDNEHFADIILANTKEELTKSENIKSSMGYTFNELDVIAMMNFARHVKSLFEQKKELLSYLDKLGDEHFPNMKYLIGTSLAAKLITMAGSFHKLTMLPASTVQLLGAEKALFKHLRNKKIKPPKHGVIINHPFVLGSMRKDKGKSARMLADKISICCKIDYFKGKFQADNIYDDLKSKLNVE